MTSQDKPIHRIATARQEDPASHLWCRALALFGFFLPLILTGCRTHPSHERTPIGLQPSSLVTEPTRSGADTASDLPEPGNDETLSSEVVELDLITCLRIAGAENLDIEFSRELLTEAKTKWDQARFHWLPSVSAQAFYNKHEGRIQETEGRVRQVSRNSGFAGAGLSASIDFASAFFDPKAAKRTVEARTAALSGTTNDILIEVAARYLEVQSAQAHLRLALRSVDDVQELVDLAEGFARSGLGLMADASRLRNELLFRKRRVIDREEEIETAGLQLALLLRVEPSRRFRLRATESDLFPSELVARELDLEMLIARALESRPELAENRAQVESQRERLSRDRLRPYVPELRFDLTAGGFGGGKGSDFNRFSERGDLTAWLVWKAENLGIGDGLEVRRRESELRQARIQLVKMRDQVIIEVVENHQRTQKGRRRIELAGRNVEESMQSLDLNMKRIRAAEGLPVEALQAARAAIEARESYLRTVVDYNKAQISLLGSIGGKL